MVPDGNMDFAAIISCFYSGNDHFCHFVKRKLSLKKHYQELKEKNIPHPSAGFNQIRVSCTCCKKTIAVNIFSRFHGNKCKGNKNGN